jgi:tripartite ATP-independent transporter DctM subunit
MIGLIMLVAFLITLFAGFPVAVSMIICGVVGCMFLLRDPMSAFTFLTSGVVSTFTSYSICVAPMFILMGELASETGLGANLFAALQTLVGRTKGGLASAVQVVCAIFGAICGSGSATSAMMCRIAYPEMRKYNYSQKLAAGCIASGSCLATLIPPSVLLITYGIAVEESIGKLFVGGIITGVVLMLLFVITIQIWCKLNPSIASQGERSTMKEKWIAIRKGNFIEIVLIFGFSMGGMFIGWFTPTEAGAVGTAGMLIVSILFKRLKFKMIVDAAAHTLTLCGMMYCLLAASTVFGKFFTLTMIPKALGNLVSDLALPNVVVILIITIIYLILGCFVDALPLMLLTAPIFLPVMQVMGYNPVWFGCYVVVLMGLAAVTPPVGISCYITAGSIEEKIELMTVFKGSIPFIFAFVADALLMAFFPGIATWLPEIMYT